MRSFLVAWLSVHQCTKSEATEKLLCPFDPGDFNRLQTLQTKMKLVKYLLKALASAIVVMQVSAMLATQFQCFSNVGHHNPTLQILTSLTMEPQVWQVSEFACALLCKNGSCPSFTYDRETQQCSTKNVHVGQSGIFCGFNEYQSRDSCNVSGEAFIAFGGSGGTAMQCVCGGKRGLLAENWNLFRGTSSFDCVDNCANSTCTMKTGGKENCSICHGDQVFCDPGLQNTNTKMCICTPAAA